MMTFAPSVGVAVPILNPGEFALPFIAALRGQTLRPRRALALDSESSDGTAALFRDAGFEFETVARKTFDHGATRNHAVARLADVEIVTFLTQDAILADPGSLERLVDRFADPGVAVVFGRQLPRSGAGAIERHARLFNYGPESMEKRLPEARRLGVKAAFNSNSFAAYRRQALEAIGGFPRKVIMGEDQYAAGRLILEGWTVVYAADATAIHSHRYSVRQEFRRYFDMGVFHARNPFLIESFGDAGGEGLRFVRSELSFLARHEPASIPSALVRTVAKLAGYRLGRREAALPLSLKRALAMHGGFFPPAPLKASGGGA